MEQYILEEILKENKFDFEQFKIYVKNYFKVDFEILMKRTRKEPYPSYRFLIFRYLKIFDFTLKKIGEMCGGRDHSTVLFGLKQIQKGYLKDDYLNFLNFLHDEN